MLSGKASTTTSSLVGEETEAETGPLLTSSASYPVCIIFLLVLLFSHLLHKSMQKVCSFMPGPVSIGQKKAQKLKELRMFETNPYPFLAPLLPLLPPPLPHLLFSFPCSFVMGSSSESPSCKACPLPQRNTFLFSFL